MTGAEVIAEARTWLGTPWRHQARLRGVGTDCGGYIGGVFVALGLLPAAFWDDFDARFGGYGRLPTNDRLKAVCDAYMTPVTDAQVGDVALMRFEGEPQHLAFLADYRHGGLSLLHGMSSVGRVCEHRLTPLWKARIKATYRMAGVD